MLRLYVSIEMTFLGEGFKREKNQLALQKVVDFLEQKFWLSRLLPRTVLLVGKEVNIGQKANDFPMVSQAACA